MLAPPDTRLGEDHDDDLGANGEHDQGGQNGTPESATPRADSLFPSSLGTTFVVAGDQHRVRVAAEWGQYLRQASTTLTTDAGNRKTVWVRHPRGGSRERSVPVRQPRDVSPSP